jgi:Hint domain
MSVPSMLNSKEQRTRRNMLKMGAILTTAVVANLTMTKTGVAGNGQGQNGQGQNGQGQNGQGQNGQGGNCLLRGTRIRTAGGERKVEDLAIGDLLPTVFGGIRPIQWIGRYPMKKSDPSRPWVNTALPVRITRSALAPNVPHADLYVTGWHALLVDGLLVPACWLTNGTTIIRHEAREDDELEFFHIKFESHDAIYAEGAPVETLLSVDESTVNFAEYFRLYGVPEIEGTRCALYASYGRRYELASRFRSAISPWVDRRKQIDVIRDRLEEGGIALTQELQPSI